jgi:hypothetical protein
MKRLTLILLCAALVALNAFGQNGTASSKATAAINTAVGCTMQGVSDIGETIPQTCHDIFTGASVNVTADNFATIMQSTIKVSNSQSLFVSPSLVSALYTNTRTKSSPGSCLSVARAMGGVYLRAVITNQATGQVQEAYPVASCKDDILGCWTDAKGDTGVVLDTRIQELTQQISACIVNVNVGGIDYTGSCTFDLTTGLMLQTSSAHSFNFIFPKVGQGVYTVEIQAAVSATASATSGTAIGAAAYGLGSLTVESVRLVHDFSF